MQRLYQSSHKKSTPRSISKLPLSSKCVSSSQLQDRSVNFSLKIKSQLQDI